MPDLATLRARRKLPVGDLVETERRTYSFREIVDLCRLHWVAFGGTVVGVLLLCLLYCLISSKQYEASARVVLRMQTSSSLSIEAAETIAPASILSSPLQLETMVNVFRSERLAWQVITAMKLYESQSFSRTFISKFRSFDPEKPSAEAQAYLLDGFEKRLKVRAMPRTLLIEIRFRSKDAALSAAVVNRLIGGYMALESQTRNEATKRDSSWLQVQLDELNAKTEQKEKRLAEFERKHNFTSTQVTVPGGQAQETLHDPTALQVDEAGRLLAAASGDRIFREALYREAQQGNPEQVLAANPGLAAEMGPNGATLVQQLRARASDVTMELAQLRAEHGPNFPRVVELERADTDIQQQLAAQDAGLVEVFRRTWTAAAERERLLRRQLDDRMADGVRENDAAIQYSVLHEEIEADRALGSRLKSRIEEAGLAAGVHASTILVLDYARVPFKAVSPDLPVYLAIALFVGLWAGLGMVTLAEALGPVGNKRIAAAVWIVLMTSLAASSRSYGQAPTPSTSGLPSGVVRLPADDPPSVKPNVKDAPPIWNSGSPSMLQDEIRPAARQVGVAMIMPIAVGDSLEVSEFHMPEFRSSVRVAVDGTVLLPLIGMVHVLGMTEQAASKAIEKAFLDQGMLLHPQVAVLVTGAVGQDVSVLGEVARPGIYPYTAHHRLLDLISAASGLSQNAGRLVNVMHREDSQHPVAVVLEPNFVMGGARGAIDSTADHNPELAPGDTILVSRAGLVYVIGDVVRPGGFAVDPVQGLTVVQAVSLAWGATNNAAGSKAILIRDQAGGRTLTTLNLRRMIRGQDPDEPVRDRDILFVPDSATKTLMNKSLESAIQSAIGVSIYAGLVYSQRF